ncbi:MAG: DUF4124 domain-containing protein [Nitrospirae bacterium]|nr:DUF4124 domain-containing protein [Nitrospirota bacterium]
MFKYLSILLISIIFLVNVAICNGEVYKWEDNEGNTHITDYPRPIYPNEDIDNTQDTEQPTPASIKRQSPPAHNRTLNETAPVQESTNEPNKSTADNNLTKIQVINKLISPIIPGLSTEEKPQEVKPVPPPEQKIGKPAIKPTLTQPALNKLELPLIKLPNKKDLGTKQIIILALLLLSILYFQYTLFSIAKKLQLEKPWLGLIPIASTVTIIKAAEKPKWWLALLVVPVVNIAVGVLLWMEIYEKLGLEKKNGLSSLFISPLVIPVIAVLFSLFNPTGIILTSLFIIYSTALMFYGSMLILPGYYLTRVNLITDKAEVSKIFEEGSLSEVKSKKGKADIPKIKTMIDENTLQLEAEDANKGTFDLSAFEPMPDPSELSEEPSPDSPVVNDGTFDLSSFEPVPETQETSEETIQNIPAENAGTIDLTSIKPLSQEPDIEKVNENAGTIDLSKINPIPDESEWLPKPEQKIDTVEISSIEPVEDVSNEPRPPVRHAVTPSKSEEIGTINLSTFVKDTTNDDTARLLMKDIEDTSFDIAPEVEPEEPMSKITDNVDLTEEPIADTQMPVEETIEGLSVNIDLDAEPEGIIEASAPKVENIEGISVNIDLDAEPAGIKEASVPIVENIEGISVNIDLDAEPAGIIEATAPIAEKIEGLSVNIDFESDQKIPSKPNSLDDSILYENDDSIEIVAEIDDSDIVIVEPDIEDNIKKK